MGHGSSESENGRERDCWSGADRRRFLAHLLYVRSRALCDLCTRTLETEGGLRVVTGRVVPTLLGGTAKLVADIALVD